MVTSSLEPEARLRAKSIDAALLGRRLRDARVRAGLTQTELGGATISTAYISRIESGQRRPSPRLIEFLSEQLKVTTEELLAYDSDETVVDANVVARVNLELDYADIALRTGQHEDALARVTRILDETTDLPVALRAQATLLYARSLEGRGHPDDLSTAILALEDVVAERPDGLVLVNMLITLARLYLDEGDLGRACDVGARAEELVDSALLRGTTEGVQLAVTVAAAHFDRGDVHHAMRICERAVRDAEEINSPAARAAAYWNSSAFYQQRGDVASALPLAQRALLLLEQGDDARSVARLRAQLAILQLDMDPPEVDGALANLERTRQDMAFADLSAVDRGRVELIEAQARLLTGDPDSADSVAESCYAIASSGGVPVLAAEARMVQGKAQAALGHTDKTSAHFLEAVRILSGVGNDREAAQLWFELGDLLQNLGHRDEALEAFRRAGASSGLHSRVTRAQAADSMSTTSWR